MNAQQREEVDKLLDQLEAIGSTQQPRPLENPLLFGNYDVAYTSTARAPTERGQREFSVCLVSWWQPSSIACQGSLTPAVTASTRSLFLKALCAGHDVQCYVIVLAACPQRLHHWHC